MDIYLLQPLCPDILPIFVAKVKEFILRMLMVMNGWTSCVHMDRCFMDTIILRSKML